MAELRLADGAGEVGVVGGRSAASRQAGLARREALETLKTLLRRVIDGLTAEEDHHIPRRERLP